jgi:long-subunit acyl-CoA synthetase (AMP-forming)
VIYRSPFPDVEIPEVALPQFIFERTARRGDKPALIDGPSGRTITYSLLARAVGRVAAALHERGFSKGDVFAIYSPNLPEYAVVFLAVAQLGGIVTTVNPLYRAGELAQQLRNSGARAMITVPPFLEPSVEAARQEGLDEVFVFGEADGATPFAALMAAEGRPPDVAIDPTDVVVMPYSSGTTGLPKGVMLTHRNLVANLCQIHGLHDFTAVPVDEHDVVLGLLPFFHIYGMVVIMLAEVRPRAVPAAPTAVRHHLRQRRPADHRGTGQAPDRRPLRSVRHAWADVRRGTAWRRRRTPGGATPRLRSDAGLRYDRAQPREPQQSGPARDDRHGVGRTADPQHRVPPDRRRHR